MNYCYITNIKQEFDCPPEPTFSQNCVNTGEFVLTPPPNSTSRLIYQCQVNSVMPAPAILPRTGGFESAILPFFVLGILGLIFVKNLTNK